MESDGYDSTVRGSDAGTETDSVASSRSFVKNQKKKARKQAAAVAKRAAAAAAAAAGPAEEAPEAEEVVVEYVSSRDEVAGNPAFAEFAAVFGVFATAEDLLAPGRGGEEAAAESSAAAGDPTADGADGADAGADEAEVSKRAKKQLKRLSIAELKQLVTKPEVVESWDVTSDDPRLLVHLKSYRNTIPVPKHWCQKRGFLQGKRGVEKPPFQLPEFIAATGIEKIRASVLEKDASKKLKSKMKEKMQPKMGKIDIDYQVLHDAFFKFQTKPRMSRHGDVYYEGKEHEALLREKRPGQISEELRGALSIAEGAPPPWLVNMQRYGPPPSYQNLKIPGLNAPIPEGATYGYHTGGWGKPPVDEFGRPLYGDVFGTAESVATEVLEPGLAKEPWGLMDEADEESEDEDEGEDDDDDRTAADDDADLAAGISSVTSTTPSGLATPDALNLRKTIADGVGTPSQLSTTSGGLDTPDSVSGGAPQLYQVLEQTGAKVGGAAFGSSHAYVVPPAGGAKASTKPAKGGIDLALDPAELEKLDEGALRARYEELLKAEKAEAAPEDVSDIIEEQERKRRRKADSAKAAKF